MKKIPPISILASLLGSTIVPLPLLSAQPTTTSTTTTTPVCTASFEATLSHPTLQTAISHLYQTSLANASLDIRNTVMTTTKDYSNVRKKLLQNYESICEDAGYTLCTTTTTTTIVEELSPNNGFFYEEVDKPICATSEDCSTVTPVTMSPDSELEMAFQDMEDSFEDNCVQILMGDKPKSCQVLVSVPSSSNDENEDDDDKNEDIGNYNLEKDYSQSPILPQLTDMCHLNNLIVCHLTTIASLDDGTIMLYETNKPMCLVKDCENVEVEEWEFMDPFPLCQNKNCEVVSQTLVCDSKDSENNDNTTISEEEEEEEGDNQCVETVENFFGNENLTSLYEELQDEMLTECDTTLRGDPSSSCHIVTPTIQTINLTTLEERHVMDVVESCVMAGISTCYVTGVATETLREVSQWEVTQVIYDHYPLCLPLACQANENDVDVLLRTHLPSFSSSLDRTMQMDDVICDISLSPSQSSIPSSSPSRTSSLFPSLQTSATPSISSSDSPTVAPSTTRSSVPSVPPSSVPATMMPSSSPIESVSNAPSPMETVDPTAAPTDPRTLVLPETDLSTSTPPKETDNDNENENEIDLVAPTSSATSSRWNLTWMVGGMMTVILSLLLV